MFYKHGVLTSPPAHYQLTYNQAAYQLTAFAAPRSFAKSTLLREWNLLELMTRPYWEIVLFLAKEQFIVEQMNLYKAMIVGNPRIADDFGWYWKRALGINSLKPTRGNGLWSNHQIQLTTGAMLTGISITGRSLGKRPHRIRFDDVEKDDSMVKEPSEKIEAFRDMLLNVVYPMAEEGCSITVIGTTLSRRSFLYHLLNTKDPRFEDNWHRTLLGIKDETGRNTWEEKMGDAWQERQLSTMGRAKFDTQYNNRPSSEDSYVFTIHEDLNTYTVENTDQEYVSNPLNSNAALVAHQFAGFEGGPGGRPQARKIVRAFGPAVSRMYRFITVDYAPTVSDTSDYSCVHVMGIENTTDFRDTLWSLDMWHDKKRQHEVVQAVYRLAMKWLVRVIGVESYGPYMELYERLREDLPNMVGASGGVAPAVIPIKFPPHMEKADKIHGLEWRMNQFRVKLPVHLRPTKPYRALWDQIENFTDDLANLEHDDAIDTLAMHQAIGKPHKQAQADIYRGNVDPVELLKQGKRVDDLGYGLAFSLNFNKLPISALQDAYEKFRYGDQPTSDDPELIWTPAW